MSWVIIENETEVHMMQTSAPHIPFKDCWCEPVLDPLIPLYTHNDDL